MPGWTQAHIDALQATIATGVLTVRYAGPPERLITYQSLDEMRELLKEMQAEVAQAASTRAGYRFFATKKGFQ